MNLDRYLLCDRLRTSTLPGRSRSTEVLSDYSRIVASSAFRRLQTKAQVFSLEHNASVRTRLTHTLEVSMFGELIADGIFSRLEDEDLVTPELRFPFSKTIQNACLLHDIGNPPFGHLGEYAIRKWFKRNQDVLGPTWSDFGVPTREVSAHRASFLRFDGNAQGFRIVTRLQWLVDDYGLNLTCGLLGSYIKYLTCHDESEPVPPFRKKLGFFEAERPRVLDVWNRIGLTTSDRLPTQRHPLVFVMEAADDIAYCLSDIEDALKKRVVSEGEVRRDLSETLLRHWPDSVKVPANARRGARFLLFRFSFTRWLVQRAVAIFCGNSDSLSDGSFAKPLLDCDQEARMALDKLKGFTRRRIFIAPEAVDIELSGARVVEGLLDAFRDLLRLDPDAFQNVLDSIESGGRRDWEIETRLAALLPTKQILTYRALVSEKSRLEPVWRTHLILDYISGMTDGHSLKVFQMLRGIQVGVSR
ncbi:MAG: dNTP triphosphohydrolase [bacterium]|nr:dNTP triphosphohydrolase [bacterium]